MRTEKERFLAFIKDLEKASQEHGIIIGVTGHVVYLEDEDFAKGRDKLITYSKDSTSGDIKADYDLIWPPEKPRVYRKDKRRCRTM